MSDPSPKDLPPAAKPPTPPQHPPNSAAPKALNRSVSVIGSAKASPSISNPPATPPFILAQISHGGAGV